MPHDMANMFNRLVRLFAFDPSGLVPLVKETDKLDTTSAAPHFPHPAAFGGRVGEMGSWWQSTAFSLAI